MKRRMLAGAISLLAVALCAHRSVSQSVSAQKQVTPASLALTIPSGQKFILQLGTAIHTNSTRKGDRVEFRTAGDIFVENQVAIPAGSSVRATVTKAKRAGRIAGRAEVQLRFDEVRLADGTAFPLRATIIRVGVSPVDAKGSQPSLKGEAGTGGNIGEVVSAGAQGALIGVLGAGAKGAMYGGAAGAAIALAGMVLRRGPDLDLPRDTMFEARFDQPLDVPLAVAQRAGQSAQSPPPESEAETLPADDLSLKTRPILRRSERIESPPAGTTESSPAPAEADTIPLSPEPSPPVTPPGQLATNRLPTEQPASTPTAGQPTPASGETASAGSGGYRLSISVKMVLVDVLIRDRAGRMIDNLAQEDFRVYEDGVEQQIQSYSRDALPLAIALVVDRSGSVAPYIDELRKIAYRALLQLKPGDKVALFSFANTVTRIEDLTTDRRRIADGLSSIRAHGSTDIVDAVFDATTYLAKVAPDYRRAVILVSDNIPTEWPRVSEGEAIQTALETETVVYSLKTAGQGISIGMRLPNMILRMGSVLKIAQETGGEVVNVESVRVLDTALTSVVSRLRLRYAIGYYPSHQAQGGAFHSIEVRLVERLGKPGSDYFIHARRGYYATSRQSASRNEP